jgi:hypothetical protein
MGIDTTALFGEQPLVDEQAEQDSGDYDNLPEGESSEPPEPTGNLDVEPTEGDPPATPGRQQKVPLAALHEERTKRQQHEADLATERQRSAQLQERFNKFLMDQQAQQQVQQQPPPEASPTFEDDPVGAFNHLQQELVKSQRQMQEYLSGTQQQTQQMAQHRALVDEVNVLEQQFKATVPDYDAAHTHFTARKTAEYQALGMDAAAAQQQLARDYTGIAQLARQQGKNPAEMLYNLAKVHGYTPGATPPGKKPNTSLSPLGGSPRAPDEKGAVSAADIADMSEAEFDKYWASMSKGGNTKPRI